MRELESKFITSTLTWSGCALNSCTICSRMSGEYGTPLLTMLRSGAPGASSHARITTYDFS